MDRHDIRAALGSDRKRLPTALEAVVERYIRAFAPERIVLFGSYAKGTSVPSSDIDLLIVSEGSDMRFLQRQANHLAAHCFPNIDVVFASPHEFSSAAEAKSPFLLSILERGIVIYERS
jgi:uncharacterized protein